MIGREAFLAWLEAIGLSGLTTAGVRFERRDPMGLNLKATDKFEWDLVATVMETKVEGGKVVGFVVDDETNQPEMNELRFALETLPDPPDPPVVDEVKVRGTSDGQFRVSLWRRNHKQLYVSEALTSHAYAVELAERTAEPWKARVTDESGIEADA